MAGRPTADRFPPVPASDFERIFTALEGLGYRPRAPVALRAFADPAQRDDRARTKQMTVFSLWSPGLPATDVDLFVSPPLPFEPAWERGLRADLGAVQVNVAGLRDLIEMKRNAARAQDREDASALEAIAREQGEREGG